MQDWFRSLSLLGLAFAAVVTATIAMAAAIVPTSDGRSQVTDDELEASATAGASAGAAPTAVGGTLAITGDREGSLILFRESTDGRYGLVGNDGRIFFEGRDPVTVARIQFDGFEFFLDSGDCVLTPGERHDPTGVAGLNIRCDEIEDIRGNGMVTVVGTIGVSADLLGLRGDLPLSGGTVVIADETLVLDEARLDLGPRPAIAGQQGFRLAANDGFLHLAYDPEAHELSLREVQVNEAVGHVRDGDCSVSTRELGILNPRVTVVEMTLQCFEIEVEGLGAVRIEGAIILEVAGLLR